MLQKLFDQHLELANKVVKDTTTIEGEMYFHRTNILRNHGMLREQHVHTDHKDPREYTPESDPE